MIAPIRLTLSGLCRAILVVALVLVAAMTHVRAGDAYTGAPGLMATLVHALDADGLTGADAGEPAAGCHGCLGHVAGFPVAPSFTVAAVVTDAPFVSGDELAPPMASHVPPARPPRA